MVQYTQLLSTQTENIFSAVVRIGFDNGELQTVKRWGRECEE